MGDFRVNQCVACACIFILLVVTSVCSTGHARNLGQWGDLDIEISKWFRSLRQPDNPTASCCGEADAYWADQVEMNGDQVIAVITDDRSDEPLHRKHVPMGTRIVVPKHKLKWDAGNPTGHVIIFLNTAGDVLCYVQNGGV